MTYFPKTPNKPYQFYSALWRNIVENMRRYPMSARDIAQLTGQSTGNVSSYLANLRRRGILEIVGPAPRQKGGGRTPHLYKTRNVARLKHAA